MGFHEKYQYGNGEIMMAMKVHTGIVKPKVCWREVVAAQESGNARAMYAAIVTAKISGTTRVFQRAPL
jgi:hypothetical protein